MKAYFKKIIDKVFEIGILFKALFGIFEILAGIILAFSGKLMLDNFVIALTHSEIAEDPKDFFTNFLIKSASGFSFFAVLYLIFHGVLNLFLVAALLKEKVWAYHWAMVGFTFFIVYQIYRYFHTFSLLLLSLTVFDILFVLIIFLEYKKMKKK